MSECVSRLVWETLPGDRQRGLVRTLGQMAMCQIRSASSAQQMSIDDLGRSGATIEGRLGFQRLVAEVGLDHVGLVLGIEMSRLARSSRDWHQLLEICSLFDTLIADCDGVYDASNFNDRLLLGLNRVVT